MMPHIFISYRRSDSGPIAGRIYDRLAAEFGKPNVFKDSYNINPGDDFRDAIRKNIAFCEVLVVVIGPDWLTVTGKSGQRRLDEPDDWVRSEIEAGIQSKATTVIPVLVGGTSIPNAADLPLSIRELAFRNGIPVRDDPDFHQDVDRLIRSLRAVKGANDNKDRTRNITRIGGISVVVLTLLLAFLALLSEEWRNDFFYKFGLYTATPLAVVQNSTYTPTPTIEAGTNTPQPPTNTDIPQPSNTPQPPMQTLTLTSSPTDSPQPSNTPTNTSNPPTSTPTPPTPAASGGTITLTIFRDEDSLTLYVPKTDEQVSLEDLTFQVTTANGTIILLQLDKFPSFAGLPFDNLSSFTPMCLRLIRDGSAPPAPLECQRVTLITQELAQADVFWYDSTANQHRTVLVLQGENTIGVCAAGQTQCEVSFPIGQS